MLFDSFAGSFLSAASAVSASFFLDAWTLRLCTLVIVECQKEKPSKDGDASAWLYDIAVCFWLQANQKAFDNIC